MHRERLIDIAKKYQYVDGTLVCLRLGRRVGFINRGYEYVKYRRKAVPVHKLVWVLHGGDETDMVDHINGNRSDNRIQNLRAATTQQNAYNRPRQPNSQSQYKGVYWEPERQRWAVRIGLHSACVAVGRYTSELLAALAYDRAVREWAGDYATLNFGSVV